MGKEYMHILYETTDDGITTITLNRPERMNAFNDKMRAELIVALTRFVHADEEKVLILTGAGRAFSTGEDLRNINLDASIPEMSQYADQALRQYHEIVRMILGTNKPIIAALNGVAAGAGMSIALACDYRLSEYLELYSDNDTVFVPAFADMGLVPDSGMVATLPRLAGRKAAQELCEKRGVKICTANALRFNLLDIGFIDDFAKSLAKESSLSLAFSKQIRNEALIYELNKRVFPWELRAQTACLQSDYFKEKVRAFLEKQKVREVK